MAFLTATLTSKLAVWNEKTTNWFQNANPHHVIIKILKKLSIVQQNCTFFRILEHCGLQQTCQQRKKAFPFNKYLNGFKRLSYGWHFSLCQKEIQVKNSWKNISNIHFLFRFSCTLKFKITCHDLIQYLVLA